MAQTRPLPLTTAKLYLEHLRRGRRSNNLPDAAARYGLRLLIRVVDEVGADLANSELAEVALVYDTLSQQAGDLFGLSVPESFRALVEVCADRSAEPLVTGLPPASPAVLETLRQRLIWVTVTYQAGGAAPAQRIVEIVYAVPGGQPMSRKVPHEIAWEDIPDDARSRMVSRRQEAVRFQLFPPASS